MLFSGDIFLEYVGCYTDMNPDRDLPYLVVDNEDWVTPTACVARCRKLGYLFAGVQAINYCFCGNSFGSMFYHSKTDPLV